MTVATATERSPHVMLTNRALVAQDDKKFLMWSEEADNS
jgi:hypothetical protein